LSFPLTIPAFAQSIFGTKLRGLVGRSRIGEREIFGLLNKGPVENCGHGEAIRENMPTMRGYSRTALYDSAKLPIKIHAPAR
jgi:hypothetical protein